MITDSDSYSPSHFMTGFTSSIEKIETHNGHCDNFHRKLYFSYVISLMEKYLYDLFIHEITCDKDAFFRMCKQPKFAHQTYPLQQILYQDIESVVIHSVKNIVWHRLNDVDPLYTNTLGIKLDISQSLKSKLAIRHHLVHRNGFDFDGHEICISDHALIECIEQITFLIENVDRKYHIYKSKQSGN